MLFFSAFRSFGSRLPKEPLNFLAFLRVFNHCDQISAFHTPNAKLWSHSLASTSPSSNRGFIDYYVDIMLAFTKKYFDNLCGWFNNMIREDDFPSAKISKQQARKNLGRRRVERRAVNVTSKRRPKKDEVKTLSCPFQGKPGCHVKK